MDLEELTSAIKDAARSLAARGQSEVGDLIQRFQAPPTEEQRARLLAPINLDDPALQSAMGFSPIGIAGMFTGVGSKLAPLSKLIQAQGLERAGQSPADIWRSTGWMRGGVDDLWRSEISDMTAKLKQLPEAGEAPMAMKDVLEHPDLFKAYPELGNIPVGVIPGRTSWYKPSTMTGGMPEIAISEHTPNPLSSIFHELQHAVQEIEGFSPGGNMGMAKVRAAAQWFNKDLFDAYRAIPGEVEARMTQARQFMDNAARRLSYPLAEPGVPVRDWLTSFLIQGGK